MSQAPTARYDSVAIGLHWAMGGLFILMLGFGFFMEDFPRGLRGTVYILHKATGVTLLMLAVFRLIWRLLNKPPAMPDTMKPWEKLTAKAAHIALYAFMLAMPFSGWMFVSANPKYPINFYWLFEVPFLPMPESANVKAIGKFFYEAHGLLAYAGIALIAAHVLAALKHRFVNKDDVVQRMLPRCCHAEESAPANES